MIHHAIHLGGFLSLLLALLHCAFYRLFGWAGEFAKLTPITARVLYTIHFFLIPFFFLFAYAAFFHTAELAGGSSLGIAISTFYAAFWLVRAIWQMTYLKPAQEAKPLKFGFIRPILLVAFFVMSAAFALPLVNHLVSA